MRIFAAIFFALCGEPWIAFWLLLWKAVMP